MTAAERFIVGRLVEAGSAGLRESEAAGVSAASFSSPEAAAVWGEAKALDGGGAEWDGFALLERATRGRPGLAATLLDAQDHAFTGALLPFYAKALLSDAWKRNALAETDAFRAALAAEGPLAGAAQTKRNQTYPKPKQTEPNRS